MLYEREKSTEVPALNVDPRLDKEQAICFGSFRLLMGQRLLLEGHTPVRLGSRALEILLALVERAGEVVSKEELMARVWPNTFVEPANLMVHVSALRRVLGDGRDGNRFLINIFGRGYCFVAPINMSKEFEPDPPRPDVAEHPHNIPANTSQLPDRADTVSERQSTIDQPQEVAKILAMLPSQQRSSRETSRVTALSPSPGGIKLEFANGARMQISGRVDAQMIWTMVTALMAKEATSAVPIQLARSPSQEQPASQTPSAARHSTQQEEAGYNHCDRRSDRGRHDLRLQKFHG